MPSGDASDRATAPGMSQKVNVKVTIKDWRTMISGLVMLSVFLKKYFKFWPLLLLVIYNTLTSSFSAKFAFSLNCSTRYSVHCMVKCRVL